MSDEAAVAAAAYDALQYPSLPRAVTQPDRLAVVGRLFGLSTARPSTSRVLELGCSDGGNLLATALAHPGAEVVGIDISLAQVEAGRATARALGASNLRLEALDLRDAPSLGTFDYVIAHGLFSWIPAALQPALLAAVSATLRPQGVAYLGLSVLPGSASLLALRALLLRRTAKVREPRARVAQARALIEALSELAPPATAELFRARREIVREGSDAWVRHELLAEENHPVWFHELAGAAASHGLTYLADADVHSTLPSNHLAPDRLALLDRLSRDPLEREQLLDDLVGRSFRRALFVKKGAAVDRRLVPERLAGLSVVARYRAPSGAWGDVAEGSHEAFRADPDGRSAEGGALPELKTRHGLSRAALRLLADAWPRAEAVDGLGARARAFAASAGWPLPPPDAKDDAIVREHLLIAVTRGLVEPWLEPPAFALEAGERPRASPLARWRAARGDDVVNAHHLAVKLAPHERDLLARLDGARDRGALAADLLARAAAGELQVADAGQEVVDAAERERLVRGLVDRALDRLARAALLAG